MNILTRLMRLQAGGGIHRDAHDPAVWERAVAIAEHLPHLFERFYRADTARDRRRGGSGIGLAIAKALAEAHDGQIRVDSRGPGHGTTFTVTVPARAAVPTTALQPEAVPTSS